MTIPPNNSSHGKFFLSLLLLSIPLFFSGCAAPKIPRPELPPRNGSLSPHTLLEKIDLNDQYKDTLKAVAHIEVIESGRKFPLRAALMLRRPSSMRVETIPLMGPPDFLASVDRNTLKVYHPHKEELYVGKATAKNLEHLIPFFPSGIRIEALISILFGTYPAVQEKEITMRDSFEDNFYRIDILVGERRIQSLWADIKSHVLTGVTLFSDDNEVLYSVKYSDHSERDRVTMPQTIIITAGKNDTPNVTIRYSDLQFSQRNDGDQFDLQSHQSTKIMHLD
ncbi:MAG: DUF4292 domain-containing protein [Deltaproteobacteria bacterium]|nr:DUF4292 domain-containing protein [Deltaproteobacteria bacterium]